MTPSALAARFATLFRRRMPPEPRLPRRNIKACRVGQGFADPRQRKGTRRIVVTVEAALFERIRSVALAREISVACAVRQLLERALDCGDEP